MKSRLIALAAQKRRYGRRRLHVLLCREGCAINRKRTYRVYLEAGLTVCQRKRKRRAGGERQPKVIASAPNVSWSTDLVIHISAWSLWRRHRAIARKYHDKRHRQNMALQP